MLDAAVLSAVASPRRREILRLVWDRERAAGEIHGAMPDVSFGAVSLQLRALSEAPADPIINQVYFTTLGARNMTLGKLATALPTGSRLSRF